MNLLEALEHVRTKLQEKYTVVTVEGTEKVKMTSNTTTSEYAGKSVDMCIEVEHIENRFEIQGEIEAIKVTYGIILKGKRKSTNHYEYFKIV